jgi:putative GTP pyrophosphokinase
MTSPMALPSKNEINRVGLFLMEVTRDGFDENIHDINKYFDGLDVVNAFRSVHQVPMNKVTLGLRSMVKTATGKPPLVSQRLKRTPRIIRKLVRMNQSGMGDSMLARLEDIGGCRAVVGTPEELEMVRARIERNWGSEITRRRDYVDRPNDMGYRALHFTVLRDGRKIEVQVRTRGQQTWANSIEAADSRLKLTLKDGIAPDSMLEYFSAAGDYIYHQEYGLPVGVELTNRLQTATDRVIDEGYYTRRAQ